MKTIKNLTANELRKSILQLAIQGKLVKQDPNDEPASELVKQIYKEKRKLIAEGKIKKDKNESHIFKGDDNCYYEKIGNKEPIKLDNLPFDIPNNWIWIRQKNICWLDNGVKSKGEKLPYLEAKVIRGLKEPVIHTSGIIVDSTFRVILVDGENSGEIMIPPFKGYMGSTFKIFSAVKSFNYDFLLNIFSLDKEMYRNTKIGAAIPHLNKQLFRESLIALPPLNEQQRIVDKINSLEVLLQKYEALEKKLTQLESTFAVELKKSILQLAIQGKLVKQDPNDEPASELVKKIYKEKKKLIADGKIKKDKNESYIFKGDDKNYYEKISKNNPIKLENLPFNIPDNWTWIKLKNSSLIVVGATPSTLNPSYWNNGNIPWLPSSCCQDCEVNESYSKVKFITKMGYDSCSTTMMSKNTVLIALTGATAGKVGILKFNACANQSVVGIKPYYGIETMYLFYQLMIRRKEILSDCIGSAQPHISKDYVTKILFALPPIKEQNRIVNKINTLFDFLKVN